MGATAMRNWGLRKVETLRNIGTTNRFVAGGQAALRVVVDQHDATSQHGLCQMYASINSWRYEQL